MSKVIPETFIDLLQKQSFASLATIGKDGNPQVTPVWIDSDGDLILVNTAKGRTKDLNMRRNPNVALSIMDPQNPYRYMQVRGKVTEITLANADEHIDKMAKKYLNVDKYPYRQPGEVRVIFKISPQSFNSMG